MAAGHGDEKNVSFLENCKEEKQKGFAAKHFVTLSAIYYFSWCSEGMGKHNSFSIIQRDVTPSAVHFKVFIYIEILPELQLGTVTEVNKRENP